jgi:ribosomal protein S25
MQGIVYIDMHIRDERLLAWLRERAGRSKYVRATQYEIAAEFGCHYNTAARMLARLRGAGHIRLVSNARRTGYIYEVRNA